MIIRPETASDASAITQLTAEAFQGAAHSDGNEAQIILGLRASGALTLSLVAEAAGEVVGHIAFSPVMLDGAAGGCWLGLGPMAVSPAAQGRGIGSALVTAGLQRLRATGAAGVVVLGDPAFYGRFGFAAGQGPGLDGVPEAYFMSLAFTAPAPQCRVQYHPAFFP